MTNRLTLKKLQLKLLDECQRLALEEALAIIRAVHPHVTRKQLRARFAAHEYSDQVSWWISNRARAQFLIGGGDGPTAADLKLLLVDGKIWDKTFSEWQEVGVPTF